MPKTTYRVPSPENTREMESLGYKYGGVCFIGSCLMVLWFIDR